MGFSTFIVTNAQSSTAKGIEMDLQARPTPGVEIGASIGWVDARYDRYRLGRHIFDSNRIQFVPKYEALLSAQYHHPSGLFAAIEWKPVDSYPFLENNVVTGGLIASSCLRPAGRTGTSASRPSHGISTTRFTFRSASRAATTL
jgi:outer membrane receptor protein involved in Fe transport